MSGTNVWFQASNTFSQGKVFFKDIQVLYHMYARTWLHLYPYLVCMALDSLSIKNEHKESQFDFYCGIFRAGLGGASDSLYFFHARSLLLLLFAIENTTFWEDPRPQPPGSTPDYYD